MTTTTRTIDATPALAATASILIAFAGIASTFAGRPSITLAIYGVALAFAALAALLFADAAPYAAVVIEAAPEALPVTASDLEEVRAVAVAVGIAVPAAVAFGLAPVVFLTCCGITAIASAAIHYAPAARRLLIALDRKLSPRHHPRQVRNANRSRPDFAGLRLAARSCRRPALAA